MCKNAIAGITYLIETTDGKSEIDNLTTEIWLQDIVVKNCADPINISIHSEVKFVDQYGMQLSGYPGYIIGKRLLAG